MTTPALTAATGPAALPGAPAGSAAPEGVFAGLLADAAPAGAAPALPLLGDTLDGAGLLGLLELPVEEPQEPVLPDGSLLSAAALGLVPAPLLQVVAPPVDAAVPTGPTGVDAAPAAPTALPLTGPTPPAATTPEAAPEPPATAAVPEPRAGEVQVVAAEVGVPTDAPGLAPVEVPVAVPVAAAPPAPVDASPGQADPVTAPTTAPTAVPTAVPTAAPTAAGTPDAVPAPPADPAAQPTSERPVDGVPAAPVEAVPVQAVPGQPVTSAGTPAAAVAPAPLERLAAETGPEQVRPAVAELARGLRDAGGGRASLVVRLDPPELGPVLVRLTVQDGRVDVQLRTSESVAAVGLGQASAEVRSTLLEHGLDLSSFDVASDADSSFSQQLSQGSPDRGTPGRRQPADGSEGASGAGAAPGVITETTADGAPAGAWL